MATKYNPVGVSAFKMGVVGADGAMGGSLTQYNGIKENTLVMGVELPTLNNVNIEESNTPFYVAPGEQVKEFALTLLGLSMVDLPSFIGGTFTAGVGGTDDTYEYPVGTPTIIQSISLTVKNSEGEDVIENYHRCQIFTSRSQTQSKNDMNGVDITVRILQPEDAAGLPITPMSIVGNTVA